MARLAASALPVSEAKHTITALATSRATQSREPMSPRRALPVRLVFVIPPFPIALVTRPSGSIGRSAPQRPCHEEWIQKSALSRRRLNRKGDTAHMMSSWSFILKASAEFSALKARS